jgi:hypothetical protein
VCPKKKKKKKEEEEEEEEGIIGKRQNMLLFSVLGEMGHVKAKRS